ncbi:DUF6476 family protein [Paenirhodobacter populi]|uniref:DUF6476 family protein n=1 Tax=Paenirhodobacter populi TaxID=2306993 RepID=UPI001F4F70BC|nr:DUF6476 family protein [Sinirhodobacter populi]
MTPSDPAEVPVPLLRFLKLLVTALAVTMILGLVAIIWLLVTRLPGAPVLPPLPEAIQLPEGATARSLSFAGDRIVVLTQDDRVLVYRADGTLIGETRIAP